ncbi:MAG: tripartite tricarboxylate transporter substrate binding protein, partial [Acetobacteraceae bacterium]|nr:tripartite tricarboxylate transporter substrate binding protein [Acetobacteraceae bacterium]
PDGRTIGLASVAPLAISPTLYATLPFDVNRDLTYISGLWQLPNLLVVTNELPVRSVPELIAFLKANPGRFAYASAGAGTSLHIAGAMFATMAGVDITHVPYRGGTGVQMDLVAGRVHMMFDNIPAASALARDGRVRALAVTSAEPSPLMPEIPTMASFLAGFEITSWGGVIGPAGLAPALVTRIAELAKQAVESPEVAGRFRENGATVWPAGPEALAAFRAANERAFAPIIRASGARVE